MEKDDLSTQPAPPAARRHQFDMEVGERFTRKVDMVSV